MRSRCRRLLQVVASELSAGLAVVEGSGEQPSQQGLTVSTAPGLGDDRRGDAGHFGKR
jgi:hypothetical protein